MANSSKNTTTECYLTTQQAVIGDQPQTPPPNTVRPTKHQPTFDEIFIRQMLRSLKKIENKITRKFFAFQFLSGY